MYQQACTLSELVCLTIRYNKFLEKSPLVCCLAKEPGNRLASQVGYARSQFFVEFTTKFVAHCPGSHLASPFWSHVRQFGSYDIKKQIGCT